MGKPYGPYGFPIYSKKLHMPCCQPPRMTWRKGCISPRNITCGLSLHHMWTVHLGQGNLDNLKAWHNSIGNLCHHANLLPSVGNFALAPLSHASPADMEILAPHELVQLFWPKPFRTRKFQIALVESRYLKFRDVHLSAFMDSMDTFPWLEFSPSYSAVYFEVCTSRYLRSIQVHGVPATTTMRTWGLKSAHFRPTSERTHHGYTIAGRFLGTI